MAKPKFENQSPGKFEWGEDDEVTVYANENEAAAAALETEIARTDELLREAGVDPDDPNFGLDHADDD